MWRIFIKFIKLEVFYLINMDFNKKILLLNINLILWLQKNAFNSWASGLGNLKNTKNKRFSFNFYTL